MIERLSLEGWEFAEGDARDWRPAPVPGTVAQALRAQGAWSFEAPRDLDAEAWWYRCRLPAAPSGAERVVLVCEGLATLCEAWLGEERLARWEGMFTRRELDLTGRLGAGGAELRLRFEPLKPVLAAKRPRPRWRTRLVREQNLRWVRTTLLGRMPGWSPPAPPVGPWRPVWLEARRGAEVETLRARARPEGQGGVVEFEAVLRELSSAPVESARARVGDAEAPCALERREGRVHLRARVALERVERWWPHTHGAQPRYPTSFEVQLGGETHRLELPAVGFRSVELDQAGGAFTLRLNGEPLFARGACWAPLDALSLGGTPEAYREALALVRAGGMNLLRLSGTLAYEADAFYDLCDELGILVWQDFMFANLDYPADDPAFASAVREEADGLLERLGGRPALAMLCGNSEIEQQAAMLGLPREAWSSPLFAELLPARCAALAPGVPYVPSTPTGGALPFHVDQGVGHYYGVGAYLRPPEDARRAGVRFASECLAFANLPSDRVIEDVIGELAGVGHHPRWKARVPRDAGASWDFEDVRDHYLATLFGVSPAALRREDLERYLALSRVVPGELMARTFAEWRRAGSGCAGGLVWFLRDLWPGAGWGVLDASGEPKAAYYFLKRAFAPVAVSLVDEGLNGLDVHLANDGQTPFAGQLRLTTWAEGERRVAGAETPVSLPARGAQRVRVEALLGHFVDASYAYRFGPPQQTLVVAELLGPGDAPPARAFHFPAGLPREREADVGLWAKAEPEPDGSYLLRAGTRRFAQAVAIEAPGFRPSDDFFHLAPGMEATVRLRPLRAGAALRGSLRALNALTPARIALASTAS